MRLERTKYFLAPPSLYLRQSRQVLKLWKLFLFLWGTVWWSIGFSLFVYSAIFTTKELLNQFPSTWLWLYEFFSGWDSELLIESLHNLWDIERILPDDRRRSWTKSVLVLPLCLVGSYSHYFPSSSSSSIFFPSSLSSENNEHKSVWSKGISSRRRRRKKCVYEKRDDTQKLWDPPPLPRSSGGPPFTPVLLWQQWFAPLSQKIKKKRPSSAYSLSMPELTFFVAKKLNICDIEFFS